MGYLDALYAWEMHLDADLQSLATSGSQMAGGADRGTSGQGASTGQGSPSGAGGTSGQGASTGQGSLPGAGAQSGDFSEARSGGSADVAGGSGTGPSAGAAQAARVPSAADLAADQAAIDAQQAQVAIARQNLAAATLTSPFAGTVAEVTLAAGDQVGAASTTSTITLIGQQSYLVSTSVPLNVIDLVKVGQVATVVVDGISQSLQGTVTQIGILNDSSSSTPSYPVTIALNSTEHTLFDGSGASVSIAVASVSGVLTVPTSAVHTSGAQHTVTVLDGTEPKSVTVQVGAVGPDLTEITSGLKSGQTVVLADPGQALPTGETNGSGFGRGGAGGAGLGGGLSNSRFGTGGGGGFSGGFVRPGG